MDWPADAEALAAARSASAASDPRVPVLRSNRLDVQTGGAQGSTPAIRAPQPREGKT